MSGKSAESIVAKHKCGYCGDLISHVDHIWRHECFNDYDESTQFIYINDENVATMRARNAKIEIRQDYFSSKDYLVDLQDELSETMRDVSSDVENEYERKENAAEKRKKSNEIVQTNKKSSADISLINELKKRPALYNRTLMCNTPLAHREKLWTEIKNAVFPNDSVKDVKKSWKNLRDQFQRAVKDGYQFRLHSEMSFILECESTKNKTSSKDASSLRNFCGKYRRPAKDFPEEDSSSNDENEHPNAACSLRFSSQSFSKAKRWKKNEKVIRNNEPTKNDASPSSSGSSASSSSRKNENILKTKPTKQDLQMLVLEKIRSHNIEPQKHINLVLASLSGTFDRLEHIRQLRVQRRFMEILEEEYSEQEKQRTQYYDA